MFNIDASSFLVMSSNISAFGTGLQEVTEVISVVRIGVSLVEYTYKVFSDILKDSGGAEVNSQSSYEKLTMTIAITQEAKIALTCFSLKNVY
jgi:hypothetical protein